MQISALSAAISYEDDIRKEEREELIKSQAFIHAPETAIKIWPEEGKDEEEKDLTEGEPKKLTLSEIEQALAENGFAFF